MILMASGRFLSGNITSMHRLVVATLCLSQRLLTVVTLLSHLITALGCDVALLLNDCSGFGRCSLSQRLLRVGSLLSQSTTAQGWVVALFVNDCSGLGRCSLCQRLLRVGSFFSHTWGNDHLNEGITFYISAINCICHWWKQGVVVL